MRLSADNYQGTVISHVMLAHIEQKPSTSIEWVKEDAVALRLRDGEFPTEAGIYYIDIYAKETLQNTIPQSEFEDALLNEGDKPFYFYVDPLVHIQNELILTVNNPSTDTEGYLMYGPALEGSVRVYVDGQPLVAGQGIRLEASESLKLGKDASFFSLDEGYQPVFLTSTEEPFNVQAGVNDVLSLVVNDVPHTIPLSSGLLSAEDVIQEIRLSLSGSLNPEDIEIFGKDGKVIIKATKSLFVEDTSVSTANSLFGFSEGQVPVVVQSRILPYGIPRDLDFLLEVNGQVYTIPLHGGRYENQDVLNIFSDITPDLQASLIPLGEYAWEKNTGKITLLYPQDKGSTVEVSYKYPLESRGPFGIDKNTSNNKAIEGTVLAFGSRINDRDKLALVVHDKRIPVALEYGGRWELGVDLDIITRDPMTREEISDIVLMYFFVFRKEALTDEGLELLDVSFGGESEEIYDEVGQDYYFNASISLTFQTDWSVHVPKPLVIERVSPVSFYAESKAGTEGWETPNADLLVADADLKNSRRLYLRDRNSDFEKIK
jgi:hypothetical protein